MYLSQEHTKKMYDEATFSNISYFFKREEINVWCDTDGSINTIICSSYCLFHNKNYCCPIKPLHAALLSLNAAEILMISSNFQFQAPLE